MAPGSSAGRASVAWLRRILATATVATVVLAVGSPAALAAVSRAAPGAAAPAAAQPDPARGARVDADRFFDSVVKVQVRAVRDARSAATLGTEREGSGVVIAADGLVLTIGYLIVEADEVTLIDRRGQAIPARVVGYDHATGFGLVRASVPLSAPAMPLGDSAKLGDRDAVMIVNHSGPDDLTFAFVVSKRPFTGSWEYLLEQAIFTSPPALNWSGAALVTKDLKLVGIGSLIVRDASTGDSAMPGNMFVPIDTLKPILADLVKTGRRAGAPRPWLGVATDEVQGRLVVSRVSPDGPCDAAGIKAGDIILGVGGDGVRTQAEFYRKVWQRGGAGADVRLRVLQGIDVKEVTVHSMDRVDYFRPKTVY